MVVAFPGNKFNGKIAPALRDLIDAKTIRVIDLAFVMKDADGGIVGAELEDTGSEVFQAFESLTIERGGLLNDDDLKEIGDALEPNSSAAVLVWEDLWAKRFADAVADSGGVIVESHGSRATSFRPPSTSRPTKPSRHSRRHTEMMRRRGGPGVVGVMATTAVMAGTAGAVRHHQEQKYANQAAQQQAAAQPQYPPEPAPAPAPAPAAAPGDNMMAQLTQLSQLHNAGVLSDEEFTAAKAKLLA